MTAVLVHGVADTYRIWDRVRRHLTRTDVVALALPGFDSPLPGGFAATKEEYVDWIIARLEEYGGPVDLVGHDWGCIFTARVASLRPDLVRTWAGGSGPVSTRYEWHQFAKIWQTPDLGEQWMADVAPDTLGRDLEALGMPADVALETVNLLDGTMKDCILRLYRSAVDVGSEWEPGLANVTAPSLVFWGADDPTTQIAFGDQLAERMRATRTLKLPCGHWTLLQRPEEIAQALELHWNSIGI